MSDKEKSEGSTWPMPKFHFEVDLGSNLQNVPFQEISGMDKETQIIEIRKSDSSLINSTKMSGTVKYGIVTMKRGVFVNDNNFWKWVDEIQLNTIKKQTVFIKLLNENGAVTMSWELKNAWPTKVSGTDLKSDGNEVEIDTIEMAHEELIIKNGG